MFSVVTLLEVQNVCLFRKSGTFLELYKWNELQNFKSNLKFALSPEVQGQSSHWLGKSTTYPAYSLSFFFQLIPLKPMSASACIKEAFTFGDWLLVGKVCGKPAAQEIEKNAFYFTGINEFYPHQNRRKNNSSTDSLYSMEMSKTWGHDLY